MEIHVLKGRFYHHHNHKKKRLFYLNVHVCLILKMDHFFEKNLKLNFLSNIFQDVSISMDLTITYLNHIQKANIYIFFFIHSKIT
jgi:hypothetical protein